MEKLIVSLFIILALAADLKVTVFPYIHWILWLLLIFPLIIKGFLKKSVVVSPMFSIASILILIGMISSFFRGADFNNLIQIVKIILILLTIYYFIYYSNIGWEEINISVNIILILNFLALILGIMGIGSIASLMTSDGRWGTFMAYPGSLVKIGTLGLYLNFLSFMLLKNINIKIISLILSFISLFVIYMDGSRTGMLVIVLTIFIIYLLFFLMNHQNKIKVTILTVVGLMALLVVILFNIPMLLQSRIGMSILNLLNTDSLSNGLALVDSARFMMLETAIDKIIRNPFIGGGAFTTVGIYEDGTSMVVHNTYLQFWGDFGLVGIIGLLFLYFSWLILIPEILYKIQVNRNSKENVLVAFSILVLCYFNLNGLFHPYSSEFSEWIIFMIPLTICYNFYKKDYIKVLE